MSLTVLTTVGRQLKGESKVINKQEHLHPINHLYRLFVTGEVPYADRTPFLRSVPSLQPLIFCFSLLQSGTMADRNPSKTSSRRITPQPASGRAGTRNTRATRSRSHDISENDAPQLNNKAPRKANNADSDGGEKGTRGRATKDRKRTKPHEPGIRDVEDGATVDSEYGLIKFRSYDGQRAPSH